MKPAVLLINGFTGHRSSLEPLIPRLKQLGLDWECPILAGHGTRPEDLANKKWADWQLDVAGAYNKLRQGHDRVVIVALSMGTLLAIELAVKHPDSIAGLILISPCVKFQNPLTRFTPLVQPLIKRFPFPPRDKFSTAEFAKKDRGYPWFPTSAFRSYWEQTKTIMAIATKVSCPVRIIQSRRDRVANPDGARQIFEKLSGPKEILWHDLSGHEMLLDCEADKVADEIMAFSALNLG